MIYCGRGLWSGPVVEACGRGHADLRCWMDDSNLISTQILTSQICIIMMAVKDEKTLCR